MNFYVVITLYDKIHTMIINYLKGDMTLKTMQPGPNTNASNNLFASNSVSSLRHACPTRNCCNDYFHNYPLAMAYVPWQVWSKTYEPAIGFHQGTIFPELNLPFLGGGCF